MEFRYPKARLFAYNKLAAGDSCYSVLVQAVTDAGLLSDQSVGGLTAMEHQGSCGSLQAAEAIIRLYMSERHSDPKAEMLSNETIKQLKTDVDAWQTSTKAGDCNSIATNPCRDVTPVVLDLLLQHVNRH
jgi:hypothetical protein